MAPSVTTTITKTTRSGQPSQVCGLIPQPYRFGPNHVRGGLKAIARFCLFGVASTLRSHQTIRNDNDLVVGGALSVHNSARESGKRAGLVIVDTEHTF